MTWTWVRSTGEFDAIPFPNPPWIVPGVVPGNGWTMLVSDAKVGKSMWSFQLVEALAIGLPFLGRHVEKRRCAYIQVDEPSAEWQQQLRQMAFIDVPLLMPANPEPYWLDSFPACTEVRGMLDSWGCEFLVLDSLYRLTKRNPNEKDTVDFVTERLRYVFPGDKPYLLLHHRHKPKGDLIESPITAASGHHTFAANASSILALNWNMEARVGSMDVAGGRLVKPEKVKLDRDQETGRWKLPGPKPPAPTSGKWGELYGVKA